MQMNEVPKRDCFQKRMQQRLTSDMGLNEYCLGQYLKKLCQKSRIKMNKKEWSTKERLFQQRIQQRVLFYLTLLTLTLIFHFISFQSFFLSYSLIYLTSLITPHLNTIHFHLNPSESHFNPFKLHLHTSTQSQVLTIIYILTKLTTDNHPNNHHTSYSYWYKYLTLPI